MGDLARRLLDAHAGDDRAALVALYEEAANASKDMDAACFYLTHAWVFALDVGHSAADALHDRLHRLGRA
ncbi:MAG: hypothetical protein GVY31_00400 [Alphaproteobacteria bacterium]|jgi:hypothetical protein|nr:hypothetical protein [Alphaproteobacteria bacterium]